MNPETHQFEKETPQMPPEWVRFAEGEIVYVKGLAFTIAHIGKNAMTLRPESGEPIARSEGHNA